MLKGIADIELDTILYSAKQKTNTTNILYIPGLRY